MEHKEETQKVCDQALEILGVEKIRFRPMNRKARINPNRGCLFGRTNLKTGLITIDIFTPLKREPKKISSILRTLCHEVAHHQRPPFRQLHRGRIISRQHYPKFYKQVTKNIEIIKKDSSLGECF